MPFALFFLGEYANMILMCTLTTILFLGGWLPIADIPLFHELPGAILVIPKSFNLDICICLG